MAGEVSSTAAHDQYREAGAGPVVCDGEGLDQLPDLGSNPSSTNTAGRTGLLAALCLGFPIPGMGVLRAFTSPRKNVAKIKKVKHTISGTWPILTE